MLIKIIRIIARIILRLIADVELINFDALPPTGGVMIASNHLGRLDAIIGVIVTDREDVILMIAEKYQKYAVWRWLGKELDCIWLDRYDANVQSLRSAYKRLRQGGVLAIAPEGTRSQTETMAAGKPGAAYLAVKTGVPIIPTGLAGTEDRVVTSRLKRLRRLNITVRMGEPFTLPPMDRQNRDAYLQEQTDEIMCRIAALVPPKNRGVYAEHPRLQELLHE